MRFLGPLIAGLVFAGVAPVIAAGPVLAADAALAANSAVAAKHPPRAAFGAGPASAKKVDGRPYFTYLSGPNGYLEDHIAVVNFAAHSQTLNVYPVDASSGRGGKVLYAPRSAPRRQVGRWLRIATKSPGKVTVKAHATVILPVFLHVPANATPGDHVGAVIVSLTGLVKRKHNALVKFEQRIATRVIIRVQGRLSPRLSISNLHAHYSGGLNPFASGAVAVSYTVSNTGNVLLGAAQRVSGHGLFGGAVNAPAVAGVPLLLPGGAYQVSAHISGVIPVITVTATARLTPQGLRGDVNPRTRVITESITLWVVPWPLLVVVIAVVAGIVALIFWRRRRRRRRSPTTGDSSITQSPQGVEA